MRRAILAFIIPALFLAAYGVKVLPWTIAYNRTDSLPLGLYLERMNPPPLERGQLACFRYQEPRWAAGRYLPNGAQICKEVLGLPGDSIRQESEKLTLAHDGETVSLGTLLPADSKGRPIPPMQWGTTVIPAGKYYLGSTRIVTSFDSRYLGLVDQGDVVGRIYPLYTF